MSLRYRTRLMLAFVLLGLFIAVSSFLVYYTVFRAQLTRALSKELLIEAEDFAEDVVVRGDTLALRAGIEWNHITHTHVSDYARFVEIVDGRFRTMRKTANLGSRSLTDFYAFGPTAVPVTVKFRLDTMRVRCAVLPIVSGQRAAGYVLAAGSTLPTRQYLQLFESIMIGSFILTGCMGLLLSYLLAARITRPLKQIRAAAKKMDLQTLGRIGPLKGGVEVERLADTLNGLFERIERSFQQINDFSSNVSHELRTPLTILRGNIEVALARERTPEEYVRVLSDLLDETIHIIRLVDNMLLLARADSAPLRIERLPVELGGLCREFQRDWETLCAMRGQTFEYLVHAPVRVSVDRNLIYQLLLNLIANASKYSPEGKHVTLSVDRVAYNGSPVGVLTVTDRGIGIPPADQPRVFERFYRVNKDRSRETGGTGLGLSICKMIVELHEGTIDLTSRPGDGTTVTVRIPASNKS